jgi:LmbE family N-acetylglucosaminyl deacetylase
VRLQRLLVVSPHSDDAVFACGDLLAAHPGALVLTVFAAGPPAGDDALRAWDADCGFLTGDDVMKARRDEDRAALSILAARPVWLAFRDDQYGRDAGAEDVAAAISVVVDRLRPTTVIAPAGIFHRDHALTHEAAMLARRHHTDRAWLLYEDAIYRRLPGDLVAGRLAELRDAGITATRAPLGGAPASPLKRRAVACYRSQLRGLATAGRAGPDDAFAPEAYWRLA